MYLKKWIDKVKNIEESKGDSEHAHYLEDELRNDFITDIIAGEIQTITQATEIAKIISETTEIDFTRWYS